MGAATEFSPDIQLHVQLPGNIQAECRLLLDGRLLLTSREPRFQHRPPQAGTYRIEVYLRQKSPLRETCPWIVSNPIFLREPRP